MKKSPCCDAEVAKGIGSSGKNNGGVPILIGSKNHAAYFCLNCRLPTYDDELRTKELLANKEENI